MHDGQDDAGRHEVGEGEVLGPVDRLLEDQRDAGDLLRDAAGGDLRRRCISFGFYANTQSGRSPSAELEKRHTQMAWGRTFGQFL